MAGAIPAWTYVSTLAGRVSVHTIAVYIIPLGCSEASCETSGAWVLTRDNPHLSRVRTSSTARLLSSLEWRLMLGAHESKAGAGGDFLDPREPFQGQRISSRLFVMAGAPQRDVLRASAVRSGWNSLAAPFPRLHVLFRVGGVRAGSSC